MKNNTRKLGYLLAILMTIVVSFALYLYNKPALDVFATKPSFLVTAVQLMNQFEEDEAKANTNYLEEILEVKGTVILLNEEEGIITLGEEGAMFGITCHLAEEELLKLKEIKRGAGLSIKGVCTGYLMDVVLIKCFIMN